MDNVADLIYLASPYSSPANGKMSMEERYLLTRRTVAGLINQGYAVWSPILHNHEMAKAHDMRRDAEHWKRYNEAFIYRCSEVWVLCLPQWPDSIGVQMEIELANRLGKPVKYVGYPSPYD